VSEAALVVQALLADPDLLVLDEPSGGLDGEGVARVVAEIKRAAGRRPGHPAGAAGARRVP
jgi:ABC-type molybdenum transport system ATPase subunit/photorepair protein PhrA